MPSARSPNEMHTIPDGAKVVIESELYITLDISGGQLTAEKASQLATENGLAVIHSEFYSSDFFKIDEMYALMAERNAKRGE